MALPSDFHWVSLSNLDTQSLILYIFIQDYRNRVYIQIFNLTVYTVCYALWRHFDMFLVRNVSKSYLLSFLHTR